MTSARELGARRRLPVLHLDRFLEPRGAADSRKDHGKEQVRRRASYDAWTMAGTDDVLASIPRACPEKLGVGFLRWV